MKLKYLALAGLFVIVLGCFLPFQASWGYSEQVLPWFIPIPGIIFLLMSKEGPFGNGRVLGGLSGLLIGIITVLLTIDLIIDIDGMYDAMGIQIAYQGPIIILVGSLLACIGGFTGYKRTSSRNFHLGTILSLVSIGFIFISLLSFYLPQTSPFISSLGNSLYWFLIFCLVVISVSSMIIVRESRKTIQ